VGLVRSHDLIPRFLPRLVLEPDRRAEGDPIARGRRAEDLGRSHLALQLVEARLRERLLLARGIIIRVLIEIAVGARFRDGLGDGGALHALQPLQLFLQAGVALAGHGRALDRHGSILRRGAVGHQLTLTVSPWTLILAPAYRALTQRSQAYARFC